MAQQLNEVQVALKDEVLVAAKGLRRSLRETLFLGRAVALATAGGQDLVEVFKAILRTMSEAEKKQVVPSGRLTKSSVRTWKSRLSKAQTMWVRLVEPELSDASDESEIRRVVGKVVRTFGSRTAAYEAVKQPRSVTTEGGEGVSDENTATPTESKGTTKGGKRRKAPSEPESGAISDEVRNGQKAKILVERSTFNALNALRSDRSWDQFLMELLPKTAPAGKQEKAKRLSKKGHNTAQA